MFTPDKLILLVYGLIALFLTAVTFLALIVSICCIKLPKARFHAVNVLLVTAALTAVLLQSATYLPFPKDVKAKTAPDAGQVVDYISASMAFATRLRYAEKRFPFVSSLSRFGVPIHSPGSVWRSCRDYLRSATQNRPKDARVAAALYLVESADCKEETTFARADRVIEGFRFYDPDNELVVEPIAPEESPQNKKQPLVDLFTDGWLHEQALLCKYRLSNDRAAIERIERARERDSQSYVWKILSYSLVYFALLVAGATIIGAHLFRTNASNRQGAHIRQFTGAKSSNISLNGRMSFAVCLIAYYSLVIVGIVAGTIKPPAKWTLSETASCHLAAALLAGVATLMAIKVLLLKNQNTGLLDALNLSCKISEIPVRLREALAGYSIAIALLTLAAIGQNIVFQSLQSSNPINFQMISLTRNPDGLALVLNGIMIVILAPILEEVVCRGIIYRYLRQSLRVIPSVFICAMIFSAMHFDLQQFLALFTIGAVLAVMYEKTNSLLTAVLIHAANNLFYFTVVLFLMS